VQTADEPGAGKRADPAELLAQRYQPRHLGLGDRDLAPRPFRSDPQRSDKADPGKFRF
jgi:hypothetical protein